MTAAAWDLVVRRDDFAKTAVLDREVPVAGPGEAVIKVDRVGVTANNVTYAVVGEEMSYWNFFPTEEGWGRVPLWGFGEVADSQVEGVEVGTRLYGYFPTSSHLVIRPDHLDERGFRDGSEHRQPLPGPYNIYSRTSSDPAYEVEREDLQVLYRPLFITSFMLDDFLSDNGYFGADTAVLSSASSKTAYGTAFLLQEHAGGPEVVGLTSAGNVAFTETLGCYDRVLSYDDVTSLATDVPTVYADCAGSRTLRVALHEHLKEKLVYNAVVGATHYEEFGQRTGPLLGGKPTFFFAPDQIRKRRSDWGPGGVEDRFGAAWRRFAPVVEGWVDVVESHGPEALRDVWLEVLGGTSAPRVGHVIQL